MQHPELLLQIRRFHSTESAILKIYNDALHALDQDQVTALLLLDFSAAFDCVDHGLLLQLLRITCSISSNAFLWIASFLSDRTQVVRMGDDESIVSRVLSGVPQGSILGPLLFVLYTTEIYHIAVSHGISLQLYADDAQLYTHSTVHDVPTACTRLAACVVEIGSWSASMRLSLNPAKTELIWLHRKRSSICFLENRSLTLDANTTISPVSMVRSLGVLFDSFLCLSPYVCLISCSSLFLSSSSYSTN